MHFHLGEARVQRREWVRGRLGENLLHGLNELCSGCPAAPRFGRANLVIDPRGRALRDAISQSV